MSKDQADDKFQLYDLRVEVVCPPGERILCGAKDGDYFTLEGGMLKLPPGQGFSIYSLGDYIPLKREWALMHVSFYCPSRSNTSIIIGKAASTATK